MAKGDYSIRYDPDRLRKMIEEGYTAKEMMKALKISPYTLKEHLVMLQEKDEKIYVIKGLFDDPEAKKRGPVKKEGIIFSKEMLEASGFQPGDAFEMSVEEDKIILKKITDD